MKPKLELKDLIGYLPYELKVLRPDSKTILEVCGIVGNLYIFQEVGKLETYGSVTSNANKPILRPLSDLESYFEKLYGTLDNQDVTDYLDADFLVSMDCLTVEEIKEVDINYIPFGTVQLLLKHHFDLFRLIPQDLAIDINTLN